MSRIPVVARLFVLTVAVLLVSNDCYAQRGRGRGMFGGGGLSKTQLVGNEQVQGELKLTDSQKSQVTQFVEDNRANGRERFQGLQDATPEERAKKFAEFQKADDAKISAMLKPEQQTRLNEIYLQNRGAAALADEAIVTKLGLTSEQKTKIGDIISAEREALTAMFAGQQDLSREERQAKAQENQKKRDDLGKATEKKAVEVLTDAQKTQFTEMKGKAFPLDRSQFQFRGRRNNNN